MHLTIDANILVGYYKEHVLEIPNESLTDSAKTIFDNLGSLFNCYLDNAGQIKYEWSKPIDSTWFDPWYAKQLSSGAIMEIETDNCSKLKKAINQFGFPNSRDFWYIKVAKKVFEINESSIFITEDMDFFDPKKKKCSPKERGKILSSGKAALSKYLSKKENIQIKSVSMFNCDLSQE